MANTNSKTASTATAVADLTPSAAAYAIAHNARQEAEVKANDLASKLRAAGERYAALDRRVKDGDDSVTSLDLLAAQADLPRLYDLERAALAAVGEARRVEAPLLARHVAESVAGSLSVELEALDGAVDDAAREFSPRIAALVKAARERDVEITDTIKALNEAGVNGYARSRSYGEAGYEEALRAETRGGSVLVIDGETITRRSASAVLLAALTKIAADAEYALVVGKDHTGSRSVDVAPLPKPTVKVTAATEDRQPSLSWDQFERETKAQRALAVATGAIVTGDEAKRLIGH